MRHSSIASVLESRGRIESLDVLRGFDMFFIMGGWQFVISLCVLFGFGDSCALAEQMKHVDWNGFHFCDFIFPLFIFISGVTFPFSFSRQSEKVASLCRIRLKILRRSVILVLLGFAVSGFFTRGTLHFGSVLGRIGVSWGLAALMYTFLSWRKRAIVSAALLLAYWLLLRFVGAPDHPEAGVFSPLGNVSGWIDRTFFPPHYFAEEGPYYNQGILATFVSAPVTAMLGIFAGEILALRDAAPQRKALILSVLGCILLSIGLFAAFGCGPLSMPVNKKLWTTSYVLVSGGCSFLILSLFYYLIDIKGFCRLKTFFTVIGVNSIAIYVVQRFVDIRYTARFFFGGVASLLPQAAGSAVLDAGYIILCWLVLFLLYKKKIFFKV